MTGAADCFPRLQERFASWTGNTLATTSRAAAIEALAELASAVELTPYDYLDSLDGPGADPQHRQALLERLLIRTTWFMREPETMQALAACFRKRMESGGPSRITIWSAACASGEEPYSVAMAFLDAGLDPIVLATDLSSEARAATAEGEYRIDRLEDLPARWQHRWFQATQPGFVRVTGELRSRVTVLPHNLIVSTRPPVGWATFDAILCRNVLLYFERRSAERILRELTGYLRQDGRIVLSAAEHPLAWTLPELTAEAELPILRLRPPESLPSAPAARPPAPASSPSAAAPPAQRRPTPAERLKLAHAAQQAGDSDRALSLIRQLVADEPMHAPAQLILGLLLKARGSAAEAVTALRRARFLDSEECWLAPYTLAICLEAAGDDRDALEAYRQAAAILENGGPSGLVPPEENEPMLAATALESCRQRMAGLERM